MGQHGSSVAHGGAPGSTDAFLPESQLLDSPRTELETGRESFEETGEYAGGTGPGQPRPALRAPWQAAVGARLGPMPQDWSQGAGRAQKGCQHCEALSHHSPSATKDLRV